VIERVTLDQAIQRALRASPQVAQAVGAVDNAFASADRFGAAVPGGTQTYSAGLSGGLDLFTGGRRIADLRRAGGRC